MPAAHRVAPKSIAQTKKPIAQPTIRPRTAPFKGRPIKFAIGRIQRIENSIAEVKTLRIYRGTYWRRSLQVACLNISDQFTATSC